MVLRDLILKEQIIGPVFRIEAGFYGYGEQGTWWRANRKISGGAIYDWGAHFTDWILNIVPEKITSVSGFQVKNPAWKKYDNEDHSEYTLRFHSGCTVTLTMSNLSMSPRPRWRVLGTKGAIEDAGGKYFVKTVINGRQMSALRCPLPSPIGTRIMKTFSRTCGAAPTSSLPLNPRAG